jgi:hypothetical protein
VDRASSWAAFASVAWWSTKITMSFREYYVRISMFLRELSSGHPGNCIRVQFLQSRKQLSPDEPVLGTTLPLVAHHRVDERQRDARKFSWAGGCRNRCRSVTRRFKKFTQS